MSKEGETMKDKPRRDKGRYCIYANQRIQHSRRQMKQWKSAPKRSWEVGAASDFLTMVGRLIPNNCQGRHAQRQQQLQRARKGKKKRQKCKKTLRICFTSPSTTLRILALSRNQATPSFEDEGIQGGRASYSRTLRERTASSIDVLFIKVGHRE